MLYAHQGGWDEMLMVLVPIAIIMGLLRLAKRRAEAGRSVPAADAGGVSISGSDGHDTAADQDDETLP